MQPISFQHLLARVAHRQRLATCVKRCETFCLGLSALYLAMLVLSRLLGLIPPWFTPVTPVLVPVLALLLALLFQRRCTAREAARLVDAKLETKDLFLTAATIERSLGSYQDLVLAQADHRGAGVRPAQIVRCAWHRAAILTIGSTGVLLLAVLLLPQLDPFGRQEKHRQRTAQQERLRDISQATAMRAALLEQKAANVQADPAKQAVIDLENTFKQARPEDRNGTFARLNEQQKTLGELWRQASEEKLRNASRTAAAQNFGLRDPAKAQQWKNDLEKGDTASVARELKAMQAMAAKLGQATDAVSKEELRQELINRMRDLQDVLAQQTNNAELNSALQRALEQLQMSCQNGQCQAALKGLNDSLDLTAAELKDLARTFGDAKTLEAALQALQSAKRLHNAKPLDGQQCKSCKSLGDYAALFDQLYQAACPGKGGNGLGPGLGEGPRPHGDENAATAYKSQQSSSEYQAGKILLAWKAKGISDSGQASKDYRQVVSAASQEASEAMLKEQIPSFYHATIKTYFDTLQRDAAQPDVHE